MLERSEHIIEWYLSNPDLESYRKGPLKYASYGYWDEKAAQQGAEIIREFEESVKKEEQEIYPFPSNKEIEELYESTLKELESIDRKHFAKKSIALGTIWLPTILALEAEFGFSGFVTSLIAAFESGLPSHTRRITKLENEGKKLEANLMREGIYSLSGSNLTSYFEDEYENLIN